MTKIIILFLLISSIAQGTSIENLDKISKDSGIFNLSYDDKHLENLKDLKVAILDNGFGSFSPGDSVLPKKTRLIEHYSEEFLSRHNLSKAKGNPLATTRHGLYMAQTVWELIQNSTRKDEAPQFYLLNAHGLTNFRRAVKFIIEEKVDIILYSQNWEFGGNFDGQGFINNIVNEVYEANKKLAFREKMIWINAAGNYHGQVFNGVIGNSNSQYVKHQDSNELYFTNELDENNFSISLSWNDFQDVESYQTNKDLALELYSSDGKLIVTGDRKQVSLSDRDERKDTLHARETVNITLKKEKYFFKIKKNTFNFTKNDSLRLTIRSSKGASSFNFAKANLKEEIMVPGDNPNVVTVGDTSNYSSKGPTLDGRNKPDLLLSGSRVMYSNGHLSEGTSNAAAITAAAFLLLKSTNPNLGQSELVQLGLNNQIYPENLRKIYPQSIIPREIKQVINRKVKKSEYFLTRSSLGHYVINLPGDPLKILNRMFSETISFSSRYNFSHRDFYLFIARDYSAPPYLEYPLATVHFLKNRDIVPFEEGFDNFGLQWFELKKLIPNQFKTNLEWKIPSSI